MLLFREKKIYYGLLKCKEGRILYVNDIDWMLI